MAVALKMTFLQATLCLMAGGTVWWEGQQRFRTTALLFLFITDFSKSLHPLESLSACL